MEKTVDASKILAARITRSASKQTFYTVRLLVDRKLSADAYRAYGYFRWLDDVLDESERSSLERLEFVLRQKSLLEACYRGETPAGLLEEEWMLVDLVHHDAEKNSGLQSYLRNMMEVMSFDARRRGQLISKADLAEYTHKLATAVTEAIHYFIGHNQPTPFYEGRYAAVTGAHIVHMLRDAVEDSEAGYFNIPIEHLQKHGITPREAGSPACREWVSSRISLARWHFQVGREHLSRVRSFRCRLAGFAYTARFEWMLRLIERDDFCLRSEYSARKGLWAGLWMGWHTLTSLLASSWRKPRSHNRGLHPAPTNEL